MIIGECAKHPGFNLVNCPMCSIINQKSSDLKFKISQEERNKRFEEFNEKWKKSKENKMGKNKETPETLVLTKKRLFALKASDDEWKSSIRGYYVDYGLALIASKGCGWYGSDGEVISVETYMGQDKNVYVVESKGKPVDIDKEYQEDMKKQILSKLTPEEISFLGIK